MQASVSVKLIGHLLDYLPNDGASFDGAEIPIDVATTVASLAAGIGLPIEAEYFVMINGDHVTQDIWTLRQLLDGDDVVYCPPLKGG